jgi:uncharacterized protein (DUF58 family)
MGRTEAPLTGSLDWGALLPLRLRAQGAALGALSGAHRSLRRGSGVEFAGHRAYTPGDDLRFLDRHALMRHGTLALREFETETDRSVRFLIDTTASMGFRGRRAPAAKLAFAALIAAAMGYVAVRGGDRVALDWLGGDENRGLSLRGGRHSFEALVAALEGANANGDFGKPELERVLSRAGRAGVGSVLVLLSDLLDFPEGATDEVAGLASQGRTLLVVQVLDPDEIDLPFQGPVRLKSLEGDLVVDTDASEVKVAYQEALERLVAGWTSALSARGSRLLRTVSSDDPVDVVRRALAAIAGTSA